MHKDGAGFGTEWTLLGLGHDAGGRAGCVGSCLFLRAVVTHRLSHRLQRQAAYYKTRGVYICSQLSNSLLSQDFCLSNSVEIPFVPEDIC